MPNTHTTDACFWLKIALSVLFEGTKSNELCAIDLVTEFGREGTETNYFPISFDKSRSLYHKYFVKSKELITKIGCTRKRSVNIVLCKILKKCLQYMLVQTTSLEDYFYCMVNLANLHFKIGEFDRSLAYYSEIADQIDFMVTRYDRPPTYDCYLNGTHMLFVDQVACTFGLLVLVLSRQNTELNMFSVGFCHEYFVSCLAFLSQLMILKRSKDKNRTKQLLHDFVNETHDEVQDMPPADFVLLGVILSSAKSIIKRAPRDIQPQKPPRNDRARRIFSE